MILHCHLCRRSHSLLRSLNFGMIGSCKISTDKCVEQSLCNSTASCILLLSLLVPLGMHCSRLTSNSHNKVSLTILLTQSASKEVGGTNVVARFLTHSVDRHTCSHIKEDFGRIV